MLIKIFKRIFKAAWLAIAKTGNQSNVYEGTAEAFSEMCQQKHTTLGESKKQSWWVWWCAPVVTASWWVWWCTATWEAGVRGLKDQDQLGQLSETLSQSLKGAQWQNSGLPFTRFWVLPLAPNEIKKEHATEEHRHLTPFPAVFVALVVILEIKHRVLCVPENKEMIY